MKKFIISEEEKNRILGMHQEATKRQYLSEQQGTKVTDPNASVYNTPVYGFLLQTNLPQFLAKNNIDLQKLIKNGARLDGDKNHFVWKPQGSNNTLYLPIYTGSLKYLDNYSGYYDKYVAAFKTVQNEFNRIKNDPNVKFQGCIKDNRFFPHNPVVNFNQNLAPLCKIEADNLDKVFKEQKMSELDKLGDIERFIQNAPKFTA